MGEGVGEGEGNREHDAGGRGGNACAIPVGTQAQCTHRHSPGTSSQVPYIELPHTRAAAACQSAPRPLPLTPPPPLAPSHASHPSLFRIGFDVVWAGVYNPIPPHTLTHTLNPCSARFRWFWLSLGWYLQPLPSRRQVAPRGQLHLPVRTHGTPHRGGGAAGGGDRRGRGRGIRGWQGLKHWEPDTTGQGKGGAGLHHGGVALEMPGAARGGAGRPRKTGGAHGVGGRLRLRLPG